MSHPTSYEVPEVLPGDLIECLETGGQGIIHGESGRGSYSIEPLPGARIKCAWWSRSEFKVVEKGPAHKVWAAALLQKKAQDEQHLNEADIDWVVAHWSEVKDNPSLAVVQTILKASDLQPDHTGYMMRGEIGMAAFATFQLYAPMAVIVDELMGSEDPKQALVEFGRRVRESSIFRKEAAKS